MHHTSSSTMRVKILFAGVCSLILSMGIARFAYTPMLPVMMNQAHLSHENGGWLAAINYTGYLSGVLIASWVSNTVIKERLYRWGMVVAVLSTALMGMTTDISIWAISRFIAGLTSAAGLMIGSGLILNWLARHNHRRELGIHFSGIGFGIAFPSAVAIFMFQQTAWDVQWFVFAGLGCLLLVPALIWFPPSPTDEELRNQHPSMQHAPPNDKFMRLFTAAYFCAGFGYVYCCYY